MRSLQVLVLLLVFSLIVKGQKNPFYIPQGIPNRDSLEFLVKNTNDEPALMNAYRELGFSYYENKRDSALFYFEKNILLAKREDRKLWEADASNSIGFISYTQGNYPRGLQFLLQAKKIAEDPANEKNTWDPSNKSMVSPHIARLTILGRSHLHLASLYGFTGNFKENVVQEFYHFNQTIGIAELLDDKVLKSLVLMNIARHYYFANTLDSVLLYENKALSCIQQTGYTRYKGSVLSAMGNTYARQKKYGLARENYIKSIQASLDINNLRSLADAYLATSNLLRDLNQMDSSLYYAKKALETYQSTSLPAGIADAYASVSATYQLKNSIDSAFKYQGLAMKARENLSLDDKIKQFQNMNFDERLRVQQQEKEKNQLKNRIITYALLAGIAVFMLIAFILLRNNRNRKKDNILLQNQKAVLQHTLTELKSTQSQLIQSEKMASLGELTAGIAHEIQNPLNFVTNFSEVNKELLAEMRDEIDNGNMEDAKALANNVIDNEEKIYHHGKRADAIVKGMLLHSRSSSGVKEPTDINALADEYLRLAYHGLRAKDKSFNVTMVTDYDDSIGMVNIIPEDITRVILNLITNAFYAVDEKKKQIGEEYQPTVSISTKKKNDKGVISVKDNGNGIPKKALDKIFQPFFTTKPTGQGTGLGLSLSYDIVKAHGGEIKVETKEGEGTAFIISFPL